MTPLSQTLSFRKTITPSDVDRIRQIVASTHFFDEAPDEIDVALELAHTALDKGNSVENYQFMFADLNGETVGYICYARVPCTVSTFEVYWLGVHENMRGKGIGKQLMKAAVNDIRSYKATKIVLETAGRAQYIPTQKFYEACGFTQEGRLKNYFAPDDDNLIYTMDF